MLDQYRLDGYKWFRFDQNNSGGRFVVNALLAHDVYIQAPNEREAINIAEDLFEATNRNSCTCCGDRWSPDYINDAGDVPMRYGETFDNGKAGSFNYEARLHYANGLVEEYKYQPGGEDY